MEGVKKDVVMSFRVDYMFKRWEKPARRQE